MVAAVGLVATNKMNQARFTTDSKPKAALYNAACAYSGLNWCEAGSKCTVTNATGPTKHVYCPPWTKLVNDGNYSRSYVNNQWIHNTENGVGVRWDRYIGKSYCESAPAATYACKTTGNSASACDGKIVGDDISGICTCQFSSLGNNDCQCNSTAQTPAGYFSVRALWQDKSCSVSGYMTITATYSSKETCCSAIGAKLNYFHGGTWSCSTSFAPYSSTLY
jgi:hypothetical protein